MKTLKNFNQNLGELGGIDIRKAWSFKLSPYFGQDSSFLQDFCALSFKGVDYVSMEKEISLFDWVVMLFKSQKLLVIFSN